MNTIKKTINSPYLCLCSLIFAALLSACSDDDSSRVKAIQFDHAHDEATNLEKHNFEHKFADQCVQREINNSVNKDVDRKRFTEPCLCIAEYMMKDLTAAEAEKFLIEKKDTQSLRIRFETAAYHCLQKNVKKAKAPVIFQQR